MEVDCVTWSSLERQRKKSLRQAQSVGVICCIIFPFLSHLFFSPSLFTFLFPVIFLGFAPLPLLPRPVENDNTLRIKNEKTRSLLLFTNVTEKHFGNYTCFASNRLGASNASMLLFRELTRRATCRCTPTMTYTKSHFQE